MAELTIYHSLIEPDSLLAWLKVHYDLADITHCHLIRMGLNDTYKVQGRLKNYIVRIYRAQWRTLSAIQAELEVLLWLKARNFPVAAPVSDKTFSVSCSFKAPEGVRTIVVFDYIDGHALALDADSAETYGYALATLHGLTDDFQFTAQRFCLDEEHLIVEPLAHIERAFGHHEREINHLKVLARKAQEVIFAIPKIAPYYGFCHGDHFGNVLRTLDDRWVFIDFDCCGAGLRLYDVVQFWWALCLRMPAWRETFLSTNEVLWQAFLKGYERRRPLTNIERQALPSMFGVRTLWGLGLQPQNERHWGIEAHERIWQQNYALVAHLSPASLLN